PAPAPRTLHPDIPKPVERIVPRGRARDPPRRWPDLETMRRALLPYLPGQLSFGSLGIRLAAYVIDAAVASVITFLIIFALRASLLRFENPNQVFENLTAQTLETLLVSAAVHLLYFGLPEGVLGWTVGKRLARLRVCSAMGVDPPGPARRPARGVSPPAALHPGPARVGG